MMDRKAQCDSDKKLKFGVDVILFSGKDEKTSTNSNGMLKNEAIIPSYVWSPISSPVECLYCNIKKQFYCNQPEVFCFSKVSYPYSPANLPHSYSKRFTNYITECETNRCERPTGRRKRTWSRAVFSNFQRKSLEKRFEVQKYIMKPERKQLALTLGLTDAQIKVWFQNRRMKWRNLKQLKKGEITTGN